MKSNLYISTIFIIAIITLAGCVNIQKPTTSDANYFKGNKGIVLNFLPNMPPDTIYATKSGSDLIESDAFKVQIEVRNKGTYPIDGSGNIKVCASGFDTNLVDGLSLGTVTFPDAVSMQNPNGGIEVIDAGDVTFRIPKTTDSYSTNIQLTTHYDYKTYYSGDICVDPDPTTSEGDTCKPSAYKSATGQGAPLSVTGIETTPAAGNAIIKLTVENKGNGRITNKLPSDCSTQLDFNDYDMVKLESLSIGTNSDVSEHCTPKEIRLSQGKGSVYCSIPLEGSQTTSFRTILNAVFSYNYKQSISKSVKVVMLKTG
ncbi:hypothetical protein K9M79_04055 [Candidatus Woesearchaeota archaeon]|nr:hypothetical protein [Candidatus Woesearchaeota archaeon]